jgi:peptide/nickel transport system ATP-binding protein/oligopeptide transport system ATP-binding protein
MTTGPEGAPLLELRDVRRHFAVPHSVLSRGPSVVKAVDGVSFQIEAGESLGLIGESGCGKSTIARMVLGLETPTDGQVFFKGRDISRLTATETRDFRRSVSAVFQDPWGALNPWMRIAQIIEEPIVINEKVSDKERKSRVASLLEDVGLRPEMARRFPHQLSGGQRQRVAIARALALQPELLVLDEPVSALDVSIRAQVMNLFRELQERRGLSYLLIAHHLATVKFLCRDLAVVYLGRIVEIGQSREILATPGHPYMRALITASLPSEPGVPMVVTGVEGEPPSPLSPPSGCHYRTRCPYVLDRCADEIPPFHGVGHLVRCVLHEPPAGEAEQPIRPLPEPKAEYSPGAAP